MKTVHKIFLAKQLYRIVVFFRSLFGKDDIAITQRSKIWWHLDLREGIDFAIYLNGKFEPETVKAYSKLIRPGSIVLDIGANIGAHTLHLAKAVGENGKVIAFEPTDYAYQKLLKNLELNPNLAARVLPKQIALGNEDVANYQSKIYSSWSLVGATQRHPKHLGTLKTTDGAALCRLDSFLEKEDIDRVDFIKIDVDGFECGVFEGAQETLAQHKPIICMEVSPYVLEERGASIDELLSILIQHNYHLYRESNRKKLPMLGRQLIHLIGDGAGINAIALPSQ